MSANKAETIDHGGTKFSFKTYPKSSYTSPSMQSPVTAVGDALVTIISQGMRRYQIFLDETYIATEGTSGDALDGRFSFEASGNQYHIVRIRHEVNDSMLTRRNCLFPEANILDKFSNEKSISAE